MINVYMTPGAAAHSSGLCYVQAPAPPRTVAVRSEVLEKESKLVLALTIFGILASIVALLIYRSAMKGQVRADQLWVVDIAKPASYYVAHAAQIAALTAAGLLALAFTRFRSIDQGFLIRFVLLIGAAVLMTARGYTLPDLMSTRLVDATGPFPYIISVLIFVGAKRSNWRVLDPALTGLCVLFSLMVLVFAASLQSTNRPEAVMSLARVLNVLFWSSAWVALKEYESKSFWRQFRLVPVAIFALGSVFVQTRLNFVMLAALLVAYIFVLRKRKEPQTGWWAFIFVMMVWAVLFASVFLSDTRAYNALLGAANNFFERLDEDTRSGQLVWFFTDVQPSELLLGRGSFATWYWLGVNWRGGTDVGYLTILLYGGVPLLLTYIAVHFWPVINVFRSKETGLQLTAATIVLLWALNLFSSAAPAIDTQYYPVLFCVGACISRKENRRDAAYSKNHCLKGGYCGS